MNNLLDSNKRELRRCLLGLSAFFLCLFSQLSFIPCAIAQTPPDVQITAVHSDACGSNLCCLHFKVTVASGQTLKAFSIQITGTGTGFPEDCWDLSCASLNAVKNGTAHDTGIISDNQAITWSFGTGLVGPATFEFMLCPVDPECSQFNNWNNLNWSEGWHESGNDHNYGPNSISLPPGCSSTAACPSCDEVDIYHPNNCYEQICFTRHWPEDDGASNTYVLKIQPALQACNNPPSGTSCDGTLTGPRMEGSDWGLSGVTHHPGPPTYDTWTITANPPVTDLLGCSTFCLDIPICSSGISHTVTITNPNGSACNRSDTKTFKKGSDYSVTIGDENTQNYPNPLSAANAFKTIIPFEVVNEGVAKVTFFDETGKIVCADAQNFVDAGRHFFYFTGNQLPAGRYFYTIESPIGNPIVTRNLLIIK